VRACVRQGREREDEQVSGGKAAAATRGQQRAAAPDEGTARSFEKGERRVAGRMGKAADAAADERQVRQHGQQHEHEVGEHDGDEGRREQQGGEHRGQAGCQRVPLR